MKVHVTGGSGFTGRFVIRDLIGRGHEVLALARSEIAAAKVSDLGATPVRGDLDDPGSLLEAFEAGGADHLVNVASLGFGHADSIIAAAEKVGLSRAVFVSTTALFTKIDASSKLVRGAAEESIRNSALAWTIVRPTMIYGRQGDRNVERLLRVIARTPAMPVPGGGHQLQQPVHVEDLSATIATAAERDVAIGHAIDVPGPEPISFRDLLLIAASAVGRRPALVSVPIRPTVALLRLYERLVTSPRLKAEQVERLGEDKAFDTALARAILDHEPRAFADGVRAEAEELGLR